MYVLVALRKVAGFWPAAQLLATRTTQDFQPWRLRDKHTGPSGLAEQEQLHVELNSECS